MALSFLLALALALALALGVADLAAVAGSAVGDGTHDAGQSDLSDPSYDGDGGGDADRPPFTVVVGAEALSEPYLAEVAFGGLLKGEASVAGCHVPRTFRYAEDGFLSAHEADVLLDMVRKGMASRRNEGGPTILDVNMGFVKDGDGVASIYNGPERVSFSAEEYKVYAGMFDRIKARIMHVNGLDTLYFTAPTFVARTVGNESWAPAEPHDEYWHAHVDKSNTEHYDFSGLVYLSDHGTDFEGGEFLFLDEDGADGLQGNGGGNKAVLPRKGRLLSFAAGRENPHRFLRVSSGTRFALSMWFTCRRDREFAKFLDGENHREFHQDEPGPTKEL